MNKEVIKLWWIKVKAWVLAFLANMWEDCLKDYLKKELYTLVVQAVGILKNFINSDEYEKKRDEVVNHLFDKITLPFLLKPFKGLIKSILISNIQKRIDEKLGKLDTLI